MKADVNLINIALEGLEENEHTLHRVIFGAAGINIPPLRPEEQSQDRRASAADVKSFLRKQSKRFEKGDKRKATPSVPVGLPPPRGSPPPKV